MRNLLALTLLSTTIGSLQPIALPHDSSNLDKLYAADRNIQQLDRLFERIYVPLPAKSFEIPSSRPSAGEKLQIWGQPSAITIKPYGRSFMFNGVRVYVEPVMAAGARLVKSPTTQP